MTKPGHNSGKGGPISADRLKSFIERIEKMEEERKAIAGDIRDIYAEAKGVGYDVATMRKIVALRAKDAADVAEQETLLDVYKHALGMDTIGYGGAPREPTQEELEAAAGRIADEVDRCMALVRDGRLPKIEDIKRLIGCSNGKAQKLRGMIATRLEQFSRLLPQTRENPKPQDGDDGITESCGQPDGGSAEVDADETVAASGPHDTPVTKATTDCIDGNECLDVRCDLEGCRLKSSTQFEAPATPSVGAVASESERVAPPTDDEAIAAMDAAYEALQEARARRTPAQGRAG